MEGGGEMVGCKTATFGESPRSQLSRPADRRSPRPSSPPATAPPRSSASTHHHAASPTHAPPLTPAASTPRRHRAPLQPRRSPRRQPRHAAQTIDDPPGGAPRHAPSAAPRPAPTAADHSAHHEPLLSTNLTAALQPRRSLPCRSGPSVLRFLCRWPRGLVVA